MSKTRKGHVVIEDITDPVLRRYAEEKLLAEQLSENSVSSYLSDLLFFADYLAAQNPPLTLETMTEESILGYLDERLDVYTYCTHANACRYMIIVALYLLVE